MSSYSNSDHQESSKEGSKIFSIESLNIDEITQIFSRIFDYSESLKKHDLHIDKIKQFAYLSVHANKKSGDSEFSSFFEDLIPITWLEIYEQNTNVFFDDYYKRAKQNLSRLSNLKNKISALITHEKEGVIWNKFQTFRFYFFIFVTFIFALLFSSVSFFAILYSSWNGIGDPYIRENYLEYLPAGVTALFASTGGILLKLSTNSFTSKNTLEIMVKIFSILLLFLVPIYVSSILSVVSGGEFDINTNNDIWNQLKELVSNIYFVIIIHLFLEMIMVFLAMHHLTQLNSERKKVIIEENLEYKKIENFIQNQEKHIIRYMGIKADLKKLCDSIKSNRNILKTDYKLKFDLHKESVILNLKIQQANKFRGEMKEQQLRSEMSALEESLKKMKQREIELNSQVEKMSTDINAAQEIQLNNEIEEIKQTLEELKNHA